jgi:probable phosphoglycerate mutase
MSIFVVRHGETEQNASRVIQVPTARLSAAGRAQAQRLAERVAATGIAGILTSDLARAAETANCISARTSIKVELEPTLRERDFGDGQIQPSQRSKTHRPGLYEH